MKRLSTAFAAFLTITASLAVDATTEHFSFAGGGADAFGSGFSSDGCTEFSGNISVSRSGTHNLSAPSTTGFANVNVIIFNGCTGSFVFETGSTNTIQFTAPGAPNVVPKSVQASGTLTVFCSSCPGGTDTLTFSMALQAVGTATIQQTETLHSVTFGVTMDQHSDSNIAFTTGTVSLSSQNFGTLPIGWQTDVSDQKTHTVTLTY